MGNNTYNPYRRKFSPAFFSPGTIAVVKAWSHSDGKRIDALHIKLEVQNIDKNAPDSYIITGIPREHIGFTPKEDAEPESYSILNVLEITHRAPGVAKLDETNKLQYLNAIAASQLESLKHYKLPKHRSQYVTDDLNNLIKVVSDRYFKDEELVDEDLLTQAVLDANIVKTVIAHVDGWPMSFSKVSKKKLHAVVKRSIPKCKTKAVVAQRLWDEEISASMSPLNQTDGYKLDHPSVDFNDPTWLAAINAPMPGLVILEDMDKILNKPMSLGQLLKDKLASMEAEGKTFATGYGNIGADGKITLITEGNPSVDESSNCVDMMIMDPISTIGKLDMTPEMVKLVTELNDGVFGKGNWEGGLVSNPQLTPHNADVEQTLNVSKEGDLPDHEAHKRYVDGDELLSDGITYVDNGETEEGNFTPDAAKDKED